MSKAVHVAVERNALELTFVFPQKLTYPLKKKAGLEEDFPFEIVPFKR